MLFYEPTCTVLVVVAQKLSHAHTHSLAFRTFTNSRLYVRANLETADDAGARGTRFAEDCPAKQYQQPVVMYWRFRIFELIFV